MQRLSAAVSFFLLSLPALCCTALLGLVPRVCVLGIHHQVHKQRLGVEAREGAAHAGNHAVPRLCRRLAGPLQDDLVVHLQQADGGVKQSSKQVTFICSH